MRFFRRLFFGRVSAVRRLGAKTRDARGQALVETALATPMLLLILVGIVEFALASYESIEVSNAAAAGVEYGAQTAATAGDTTGIQNAAAGDAGNVTLGPTTTSEACICSDGSSSTCQPTDCPGSNIETILTVQTQATFNPGLHIPGISPSLTLQGQASEKVLQ